MLNSIRKLTGPLTTAPRITVPNTLLRSNTANVHGAANTVTTNVDISSLGITDITKVKEIYLGHTHNAGIVNSHARVRITSTTNLEVVSDASAATTVTVYWAIVSTSYSAQRGVTVIAIAGNEVTGDTTITGVTLATAREMLCGYTFSVAGGNAQARVELTSTTNLRGIAGGGGTGNVSVNWVVDG